MYFKNRAEAGKLLARELLPYSRQSTTVLALSQGAAIVGAQIAMQLHTNLLLYFIKNIYLPGELDAIAGLGSTGNFTYNNAFSAGELEDATTEFRGFLEQRKFEITHEFNVLLGNEGVLHTNLLRHKVVIVVSDGLESALSLDVAADFLKTVAIKRLIVVTPVATVKAVDRMHLVADEIHCLSVPEHFMGVDHYYEENTLPNIDDVLKIVRNIAINWSREKVSKKSK